MRLRALREEVARLHQELPRNGLVAWTSGNLSGRDPDSGLIVIKPSGLRYEELTPESMVVVDEEANVIEGHYNPSSDTASHCYIYREMPDVGGVVHTHSPYATAWAAVGREIPCFLTAMADEFGGPIPCGGFAPIGGEEIGREVVRTLRGQESPAVVMQNHGVFAVGKSPLEAIKAAVMCEDVARTSFLAVQLSEPIPLSEEDIARLHERYTTQYGQKKS
ncbi:L-ribulose-5-phosphate 4-epimerase [Rubrobacter naiadicus]|uniref:L-ribulose-5-phosphate 4-epimerase n=1 Tax=Rubrobacter naiadicus TaxID=1392641 RepID=UPI0023612028|nr:L-ribulose-5-phosphate 4-epimerase [Rubrobacter naiadicus]